VRYLLLVLLLAGCVNPVKAPTSPQEAINEANITIAAAATVVAQNVQDKIFTKEEGQRYVEKLQDLARKVDEAQKMVDSGLPDAAKQAEIVRAVIVALHREIAARARRTP
jgi:soluble cytochrome b562